MLSQPLLQRPVLSDVVTPPVTVADVVTTPVAVNDVVRTPVTVMTSVAVTNVVTPLLQCFDAPVKIL